ncbi:hypothetical protein [Aquibacillus kalidii]|uniref:hypothetical protein n=1 Tax=Aquibacillus kalidii TaxID=2762597 RepID=UPI001647507D|nr:hypothetical protein [Aquibacillus kalidii]
MATDKQIKQAVHSAIGDKPLLKGNEYILFQQRGLNENRKKPFTAAVGYLVIFSLAICLSLFTLNEMGVINNHTSTEEAFAIDRNAVMDKVETIKQNLKVGMTKEQVRELFGEGVIYYNQNTSTAKTEIWIYNYFEKPGTTNTYDYNAKDIDRLEKNELGIDMSIIWNGDKVERAFFMFKETDASEIITVSINEDDTITEEVN